MRRARASSLTKPFSRRRRCCTSSARALPRGRRRRSAGALAGNDAQSASRAPSTSESRRDGDPRRAVAASRDHGTGAPRPIVSHSRPWRACCGLGTVAGNRSANLIAGESGTGRSSSRFIHDAGPHHNQPFIAVNCAALPRLPARTSSSATSGALHRRDRPQARQVQTREPRHDPARRDQRMEPVLRAKLLRVLQNARVDAAVGARRARHRDRTT